MKITYNWLKEFVDFRYSPHQLAEHLTMLGLEVELVVPVKPAFSGVVVGKILEIIPHPNAEKLLVCKVTAGPPRREPLTIICGAHNIQVGDLVPVATIGASLANGTKITKRIIKGITSTGMLCSEQELGLSDYISGIFILSKENLNGKTLPIGKPLEKALKLEDAILDISITPNRADALSVIGIGREISALTKNPLKQQKITFPQKGEFSQKLIKVNVKNKKLCPRYTARIISGVEIKPSPFWLRYRLGLVGMRSINNVVDITNYVLLECGQPLHTFDYELISGNNVIIRGARSSEKITTIDNETKTLDKDMLVIADKQKSIAVAGVIGGKDTEVKDNTRNILIESAYFDPKNVRRTAKKLGISTESSFRFERGLDPELAPIASNRATQLILGIAGGKASKELIDCVKDIPKTPTIGLHSSYCNQILGTNISREKMSSILKNLGCKVTKGRKTTSFRVKPPNFRRDLVKPIDLVEEIARVFGYPNISFSMPEAEVVSRSKEKTQKLLSTLQTLLTGMGLDEIITYSFIAPEDLSRLRIPPESRLLKYIHLKNPVSQQTTIMRTTLIPGIIKTILLNINNGNTSLSIFETGKCFFIKSKGSFPKEDIHLAIGLTGSSLPVHWKNKEEEIDFFSLKGILKEIMNRLTIYKIHPHEQARAAEYFITSGIDCATRRHKYQFSITNNPILHPGRSCSIKINNREIGFFGQLHPAIASNYGIDTQVYIAELDIASLIEARELPPTFKHIPKYPGIRRDMSIIVDNDMASYDIIKLIQGTGIELIESVEVFDLYKGDPIPEGKKSLAYTINYRHKERTLTDKEVENIHNTVRQKILEKLPGVKIRE